MYMPKLVWVGIACLLLSACSKVDLSKDLQFALDKADTQQSRSSEVAYGTALVNPSFGQNTNRIVLMVGSRKTQYFLAKNMFDAAFAGMLGQVQDHIRPWSVRIRSEGGFVKLVEGRSLENGENQQGDSVTQVNTNSIDASFSTINGVDGISFDAQTLSTKLTVSIYSTHWADPAQDICLDIDLGKDLMRTGVAQQYMFGADNIVGYRMRRN